MRSFLLVPLLLLPACGGGATVPAQSIPSAPIDATFPLHALDEVVRDGKVIFVDADGTTLRAIDVATGQERWHTPLGIRARAALVHTLDSDRVMVQASQRFVTVLTSNGAIVHEREAPASWQFVQSNNRACSLSIECGMQPIACDDGRPLGEPVRGSYITFSDDSGEATSCATHFDVLGRAGDLSLYQADSRIIARNVNGATAWEREDLGCQNCTTFFGSGVASDATLCWTSEYESSSVATYVFSCASGEPRFTHSIATSSDGRYASAFMTAWVTTPAGIFIATTDSATLVGRNGSERWTRPIPEDTLATPEGARYSRHPIAIEGPRSLATLDPQTGNTLGTVVIAPGELRVVEGVLGVHPANATSDRGGAVVPAPRYFAFERHRSGSRVFHGSDVVLALPGDGHVVGEVLTEREALLVVAEVRNGAPDIVHMLRAPR